MENFSSNEVIRRVETILKQAVDDTLENYNPTQGSFSKAITSNINKKMRSLSGNVSLYFPTFNTAEIRKVLNSPVSCNADGIISGKIEVTYCEKQNITKYGGPGYPGKEDGQLCEYPENSKKFYKWNGFLCKWEDVYKNIDRGIHEQSWYDKLTDNAAFEPWWGDNNSGGNYLRSDRHRNGADNLWGDPGVHERMGTFNKVSADLMKAIYNFTLNIKAAIEHYENLSNAFGFDNENFTEKSTTVSEKEVLNLKDTTTYTLKASGHDVISKKQVNGFISNVIGIDTARRDSAYHVSSVRGSIQLEVVIKKKYDQ